jgi:hypothetical protein
LGQSRFAYSFGNSRSTESERTFTHAWGAGGKAPVWLVWVLSVLLLISAGIAYRVPAQRIGILGEAAIMLPVPLSDFPMEIGNWVGTELPIGATTKEYMKDNFADDYFSRRYVDSVAKAWADVYVVYCSARPGGILGHRPNVCYQAHGWQHESTEKSRFTSRSGRQIDCLVHRFHKPAPEYDRMVVLSFYVLNGRTTAKESDFSGPFGRRPNIARDPSRYVAQVQISSTQDKSVEMAAEQMADLILDFLPDENSRVEAAESVRASGGDIKSAE